MPLDKDFYIAEAEIELLEVLEGQPVTLRGCALKTTLTEKTRLLILSNFPDEAVNLQEIAGMYLNRWPNLEEAFEDFSRKIEFFTYAVSPQHFFSIEELKLDKAKGIKSLFNSYFSALDAYLRQYFLPFGHEIRDFSFAKAQFYDLKVSFKKEKDYISVFFQIPPEYQFTKELRYICHRLNEREIIHSDGNRLWFLPP